MNARHVWTEYVDREGGPAAVSRKLGIPLSTIAGTYNGSRGIGRELARTIAAREPLLDEKLLVWVEPVAARAN